MKGTFERVRELYIFKPDSLDLASGCTAGCGHGGCWRTVAIARLVAKEINFSIRLWFLIRMDVEKR
jgi:hypothetical protein